VRVTFRGASEVCFIEGQPPEGEIVGTVAKYFNAEAGGIMQVVSWTGDEVEFYDGADLSPGVVSSAFGLSPASGGWREPEPTSEDSRSEPYRGNVKAILLVVWAAVILFFVFGQGYSCARYYEARPPLHAPAATPPLAVGTAGTLLDKHYRITAHSLVEISEVNQRWDRHEYELTDDVGSKTLLVCGEKSDATDWILYQPYFPTSGLGPQAAAAQKMGDRLDLDGFSGKIDDIFSSRIKAVDGDVPGGLETNTISYGFHVAGQYNTTVIARWTESGMLYFRGQPLPGSKITAAFVNQR